MPTRLDLYELAQLVLSITLNSSPIQSSHSYQKLHPNGVMARLPYPDYHTPHAKSRPILNVMKLLSYSNATVNHWADVGNAQFKNLSLSPRDRELVIMLTTSKCHSSYEWTHHLPLSLKAGVTKKQQFALEVSAKQKNYFIDVNYNPEAGFSEKDRILLTFVETIIQQPEVSDELWKRVKSEFSNRQIVEIISLQVSGQQWKYMVCDSSI
jgi:alkylhydroperoxidase family enzyme